MKRPPCAWNIPTLATGSFFFFFFSDSHSDTHPLTPLHLATRIEAAKRHWRPHWACRLTWAHPGMRLVEDHPSRLLSPGCLGQFMTPTRGDCTVDTLESKWLSHRPAPLLPASIFDCLFCQQISLLLLVWLLCFINHTHTVLHTYFSFFQASFGPFKLENRLC